MVRLTTFELIHKIQKDENINFIAFPLTPWAAHGVIAYINYLLDQGKAVRGFIGILKHPQAGYILSEKHFASISQSAPVQLFEFDRIDTQYIVEMQVAKSEMRRKCRQLYILRQSAPDSRLIKKIKHFIPEIKIKNIILDEGLAMYMRSPMDWLSEHLAVTKSTKDKMKAVICDIVYGPLMLRYLKTKDELEYFSLFSKNKRTLEKNNQVCTFYAKAIRASANWIEESTKSIFDGAVVINTQPFYDNKEVFDDADLRVIEHIVNICNQHSIRPVLKLHPREKTISRYDHLKCIVDQSQDISQEALIANLENKPKAIIGFSSTTLVSENVFEGIKTISMIKFIDSSNVCRSMQHDFRAFAETFYDYVLIPETWEEFEEYLST